MATRNKLTEDYAKQLWREFIRNGFNIERLIEKNIPLEPDKYYGKHFKGWMFWLGWTRINRKGIWTSVKQANFYHQKCI